MVSEYNTYYLHRIKLMCSAVIKEDIKVSLTQSVADMLPGFASGAFSESLDDSASSSSSVTESGYDESSLFSTNAIEDIVNSLYLISIPLEDVIQVILDRRARKLDSDVQQGM